MARKVVYEKKGFVVYSAKCGYVVHNTRKQFAEGHSHFDSLETAEMVIDWCIKESVPHHMSRYILISLIRLTTNYKFKNRLKNELYNQ